MKKIFITLLIIIVLVGIGYFTFVYLSDIDTDIATPDEVGIPDGLDNGNRSVERDDPMPTTSPNASSTDDSETEGDLEPDPSLEFQQQNQQN